MVTRLIPDAMHVPSMPLDLVTSILRLHDEESVKTALKEPSHAAQRCSAHVLACQMKKSIASLSDIVPILQTRTSWY